MSNEPTGANEQSLIVNQLIAEFMSRTDAGEDLDVTQFLSEHPEHAAELEKHFANVDLLDGLKETGHDETILKSDADSEQSTDDATANTIVRGGTDSETSVTRDFERRDTEKTEVAIPENFGRYAIQKVLGQGAMGAVYLARDTQLDRDVALKIPKFGDGNGVDDEELLERFYREARASATLRSPNICPVHDVGEIDGQHYITMAYIEGRPLKDFTKSKKQHSEKQIITTIRKLAVGLEQAHKIGVIHRDLKPANIMVDQQGEPVVMDFGLARRSASDDVQVTQSGAILGTPAYMSPEQVEGDQSAIGPQTDIYALGVIMYELLTGEMPFKGALITLLSQIAANNPTKPSELRSDLDPRLEKICLKMMAGDLTKRYESMTEVANDLQEVLRHPNRKQKKKANKKSDPKPTSIPSANEESNPALISVEQPKSYAEQLRKKKSKSSSKSARSSTRLPVTSPTDSGNNNKKYLIFGGLGGLILLLGIVFLVRVGKYDVQITLDDPSITLSVDGEVLNIKDGQDVYQLSAGEHKLQLQKDGLKTHVEEFSVTKDGKTALRAVVVNGKLDGLINGEEPGIKPSFVDDSPEKLSALAHITPAGNYALEFTDPASRVDFDFDINLDEDFTVEFWVTPMAPPTDELPSRTIWGIKRHVGVSLWREPGASATIFTSGSSFNPVYWAAKTSKPIPVQFATPAHLALVKEGSKHHFFLDGQAVSFKYNQDRDEFMQELTAKSPSVMNLGDLTASTNEAASSFTGLVHSLRLSKGRRYSISKNFTPPPQLLNDPETLALYEIEAGTGDVLIDASGNGHDGKIIGAKWVRVDADEPTPAVAGADNALAFTGKETFVKVDSLQLDTTQPHTMEAWVWAEKIDGNVLSWDKQKGKGTLYPRLILSSSKNRPDAIFEADAWKGSHWKKAPPQGRWMHLAGVHDANGIRLYVDGKLAFENKIPLGINGTQSSHGLRIGGEMSFHGQLLGQVDEVRISQSARYAKDFTPSRRFISDGQTLALYHFDEGSGDVLKDSSGNGHDGKIIGAKWVKVDDGTGRNTSESSQPRSSQANQPFSLEGAEWSEPVNLGNLVNTAATEAGACLSANGLTLYFHSKRTGGSGDSDLWQTTRTGFDQPFSEPTNLGPLINSDAAEQGPAISADELEMIFFSNRAGGEGDLDIWRSTRKSINQPFGKPTNLGPIVNSSSLDAHPALSPDGKSLVFVSERPGGKGDADFYLVKRESIEHEFGEAVHLSDISSPVGDFWTRFTPDGNAIVFGSWRKPNLGAADLWITKRNQDDGFDDPVQLPGPMNTSHMQGAATFTPDGQQVIFDSARPGGAGDFDIWMCRRIDRDPKEATGAQSPVDEPIVPIGVPLELDGIDDFVELPELPVDGNSPFTFECWVNLDMNVTVGKCTFFQFLRPEGGGYLIGENFKNDWNWTSGVETATEKKIYTNNKGFISSSWQHLAVVFESGSANLFIDGKKFHLRLGHESQRSPLDDRQAFLGQRVHGVGKDFLAGKFCGVRISKGARYQTEFDPPRQFDSDENTIAVYKFEGQSGDVLKDSSGNGHHGKIVGAKWLQVPAAPESERDIAEWILSKGGMVGLTPTSDADWVDRITTPADLPDGPLEILLVSISNIDGRGLERITSINDLRHLYVYSSQLSDDDLKPLERQNKLAVLLLNDVQGFDGHGLMYLNTPHLFGFQANESREFGDEGLRALSKHKQLGEIHASETSITDAGVEYLKDLTELESVGLGSPGVTDRGVEILHGLKKLKRVHLYSESTTQGAVDRLQKALPECHITRAGSGGLKQDRPAADGQSANGGENAPPPAIAPFDEAQAKAH